MATSPRINGHYKDNKGRKLEVHTVDPANHLGREVQGTLTSASGQLHPYSTSLQIFSETWKEDL